MNFLKFYAIIFYILFFYKSMKGEYAGVKYIDRFQVGLELYLSQMSTITSPLNENSPEETVEYLKEERFSVQTDFCRQLQSALRRLISDQYDVEELIPARVRALAESQFTPSPERLLPIFKWISALHLSNKRARVRWLSELNNVSNRIGMEAGHFLQSFSLMTSQRISLIQKGEELVLSMPDRPWGNAKLVFHQAKQEKEEFFPAFGYLFWIEAETREEGYEFRLCLDTEFSDTLYTDRLLQKKNWMEIEISCSSVHLETELFDYTGNLLENGMGAYECFMICCRELLHKASALGMYALNQGERELLGIAQLLYHTGILQQMDNRSLFPPLPPENLFENRYSFERTASLFQREGGLQGERIHKLLLSAIDAYEEGRQKKFEGYLEDFFDFWSHLVKTGLIRRISHSFCRLFAAASKEFEDQPVFSSYLSAVRQALEKSFSPLLERDGFSGKFPHYRRVRKKRAEYLSFVLKEYPAVHSDGRVYLSYSMELGRCRYARNGEKTTVLEMPFEDCTASECRTEKIRYSDFLSLTADSQGREYLFIFEYGEPPQESQAEQMAEKMTPCLELAMNCFDNKPVSRNFARQNQKVLRATHRFSKLLGEFSPLGLLVVIFLLLWGRGRTETTLQAAIFITACILFGVLVILLCSAYRYFRMKRRLWNREK